ncbi:MAG: 16S rRNA (adenine(1518)-N(6)/adenine(1519)-N(6))-dimethyltransferase RsmA [Patescibacteria group bacterium]|nr:16S rRNA (adenine(1518)-N(6)/adenine(1519)-N(6))-dimethyltransferase RsmA [Patescibacteria group bacterium]
MRAKKSLGQNWLNSAAIRSKIIKAAKLGTKDAVLEIGPGRGFLTGALLKQAGKVVAVEKDDRLISFLNNRFSGAVETGKLVVIHGDIVDQALKGKYKVVANIPYYLTGQILRQLLTAVQQPELVVLMLQQEVAERIATTARRGARTKVKESLLSLSVKVFGQPRLVARVAARHFTPRSKVDSAILLIDEISRDRLATKGEEERFFTLLKKGFAHKRKLLASNLNVSTDVLESCKIEPKARAEELTLEQWLCLTNFINTQAK